MRGASLQVEGRERTRREGEENSALRLCMPTQSGAAGWRHGAGCGR